MLFYNDINLAKPNRNWIDGAPTPFTFSLIITESILIYMLSPTNYPSIRVSDEARIVKRKQKIPKPNGFPCHHFYASQFVGN